jgi:hypothetical protein
VTPIEYNQRRYGPAIVLWDDARASYVIIAIRPSEDWEGAFSTAEEVRQFLDTHPGITIAFEDAEWDTCASS